MAREFAAFISYRHRPLDMAVAVKVHKCIERFKIPRDLLREERKNPGSVFTSWNGSAPERLLVFRDRDELPLSNDLTSDIFEALNHANCLIVICTPDTPKSLWVRREISHYIEKHGRKRIITVLAAGTPEESIPKEITTQYAEDGVTVLEEYEPLVAYLVDDSQRKVLKNLDKERLRICAAILGCPYDSLRQRHKRRRMQQALAASAAAFLVALSFIGMLVNRNQEIQAQKRMVQLHESELLAADAREALDAGNTRAAIESAVAALPKEGDEDRPYYALAENVLMEAMDVLGGAEDHLLLSDTVLKQMTPIAHFDLSPDGKLAVTIDEYGVVHCFDTATGQEKWSQIVTNQKTNSLTSYVRISGDESCVVCQYGSAMEGRDLQTGQLLWSHDMSSSVSGYFICDDSRNQIALLRDYPAIGEGYVLDLEIISAVSGISEQIILLERTNNNMYRNIHNTAQVRLPTGGTFSADGRYFACAFARIHTEEGKRWLDCFVVDLQEGTVVTHYTQEISFSDFLVSGMEFREDGLLISLEVDDDTVAGSILKLDWQANQLLWHTTTPGELSDYFYSSDLSSSVMFCDTIAILGRFEKLYSIDLQTGAILASAQLPGTLSGMYPAGNTYFAFTLRDGTYAIGWYGMDSGFALTTDYYFYVTVPLGEQKLLCPYGGGIIQKYDDGNYLEISISNVDCPGYLALVSQEDDTQLIIRRPVTVEKSIQPTAVSVPVAFDRLRCSDVDSVLLRDNTLILGQFYGLDEDWNSTYFHIVLDPVTHEVKQVMETEDMYYTKYFFLPDGSGYLTQDREGNVTLVKDEQETVLFERIDPHHDADLQISVRGLVATDNVYLQDGTVLTVHSDTKDLTVMKDGVEVSSSPFSNSHQYSEELETGVQRYIQAGRNGYVVTHFTSLLKPVSTSDVAFYDTVNNTWFQPELDAPFTNTRAYAFAESAPLFAAVDGAHMVRVMDLQQHTEVTSFSLQLPCSSVLHLDFLLDNSCLMVKTQDANVLIYEIATGKILFQDQLETTFTGTLSAWKDPVNQRLYILDTSLDGTNALCIDLRSWTVLSRAEKILCYIPETNELYFADSGYGSDEAQFFFFQVPDTDTLVKLGQQMLTLQ